MASILGVQTIQHTNGTTALSIGSNGFIQPKQVAFQAVATDTDQAISASTDTVIEFNSTTDLDTGGYWDSTNHRFTPQVAGWYFFSGSIRLRIVAINQVIALSIRKNGTSDIDLLKIQLQGNADIFNNGSYPLPSGMIHLNGSTDYVDAIVNTEEAGTASDLGGLKSFFSGFLVHAT